MNNEFTKKQGPNETRYILEFASGGGTSSASIASSPTNQDSILVQSRSGPKEVSKPRNFVAKHAQTSGAGAHKDRKKAAKQGDMKHKKSPMDMSEGYKFKGGFPFDVDHMNGPRGIGLSSVETKKFFTDKQQWTQAVNKLNSSLYNDDSNFIGITGRSTVEIDGHEWARWSDAEQKGYVETNPMSQGVAEGDVISTKFATKQAQKGKDRYQRQPDVEIPLYDRARNRSVLPKYAEVLGRSARTF